MQAAHRILMVLTVLILCAIGINDVMAQIAPKMQPDWRGIISTVNAIAVVFWAAALTEFS